MIQVILVIPGTPTAKARPRFYQGRAITDAKTRAAERTVLAHWLKTRSTVTPAPHDGPVTISFEAVFAPAQSWPKWKQQAALDGYLTHTSKPDLDNLVKIIDGLNGHAWVDDSQISRINASKTYGDTARTIITINFHPTTAKRKTP